ncbi:hypothetical protein [Natronosalvus vescus]|uniref:hypothetical protein n=1 Tax=Natronosalvus vescus TaxID=2953881 RepID=UPI0020903358|nr:hypothetical protein [Natronosalvus vescus]
MDFRQLLTGDPGRSSWLYLGIGTVSLLKALAVRNDRTRFRRELLDAALFLGVGLALRKYSTLRAEKREELRESVPDWVLAQLEGEPKGEGAGLAATAKQRFGGTEPEPGPKSSIRTRAKGVIGD